MATTTDVEPIASVRAAPTKKELAAAYSAILDGEPLAAGGYADPDVISRAIVERILQAETFEDAFSPQDLTAWNELLGVPCKVQSFHLNPTGYEGAGSSVYAVVDIVRTDTGEALTVTCGGRNVLAQLVKMLEKGWFEHPVQMTAKGTSEGFQALWLVPA
jgi:hypothetical protein